MDPSGTPPDPAPPGTPARPSHLSADGRHARMVDVGGKPESARRALAAAVVAFPPGVLARLHAGAGPKGPVEEVARVAGILAAKNTAGLIPLCHPLGLDQVDLRFEEVAADRLEVRAEVRSTGRTGVEMEALTACAVAALTVYDMAKALGKGIVIEELRLLEKDGGKSGSWRAASPSASPERPSAGSA